MYTHATSTPLFSLVVMRFFVRVFNFTLAFFLGFSSTSVFAATVTPGDIGYWRFENTDASLTTLQPLTTLPTLTAIPNTGNGSYFPVSVPNTGTTNTKMAAFGSNTTVSVANSDSINLDTFTFEAFVCQTARSTGTSYLASKFIASDGSRSWSIGIAGTNGVTATNKDKVVAGDIFINLSSDGGSPTLYGTKVNLTLDTDYFVAVSFDNVNCKLRIDLKNLKTGVVNEPSIVTVDSKFTDLFNSTASIALGSYNGGQSRFTGFMDEVRLTNGVLDPSQYLIAAAATAVIPEPQHLALLFGALASLLICGKRLRRK